MKKGVIFDFNGTMFFDSPKHKIAWDVFSQKYRGKAISEEEMDHMHGQTNRSIITILMGDMCEEESEKLSQAKEALYRDICRQQPESFHLAPGLVPLLDQLKEANIPMNIASASIKANIDFFVESFQLDRWFDVDKIVYDDGLHENKITMFQDSAKRIHLPLSQCLIIEDSLSGIAFAHACHPASIIAIASGDKKESYQKLPGVDKVIEDFNEFDISFLES